MSSRLVRSPRVLSRRVGPEVVLAAELGDGFDRLSPTATAVWELLAEPITRTELLDRLAAAYAVEVDDIADEVDALLEEFEGRGWLEPGP